MIALTHFGSDEPDFLDRAGAALAALAARPGYLRGSLGRSTDDPDAWLLLTEWENVGSYRRALGGYEVKLLATPLLASAQDVPSAFETLLDVAPGGALVTHDSDREHDGGYDDGRDDRPGGMTTTIAPRGVEPESAANPPALPPQRRFVQTRRLALAAWAVAATLQIVLDGVPFDRLSMFAWVGSLLLATSIGRRGVTAVLVDWGPFVLVLMGYDFLRGLAGHLGMPTLWSPQIDVDKFLFDGHVPTVWLQDHLKYAQPRWWDVPVALCYVSYFVMPTIVAGVLWLRDRVEFRRWAARYVGLCLLAFTVFALFPAAPPWAAGRCSAAQVAGRPQDPNCMHVQPTHLGDSLLGGLQSVHAGASPFVSRIASRGFAELHIPRAGSILREGQAGVDLTAALPSLHSAGVLLLTLFLWRRTRRWWTRALLVAYPLLMTFTLVYSGEHYVSDVLAGWLAAAAVTVVAGRVEARWAARGMAET